MGLRVLNSHYAPICKCHNGQSTIDFIFVNFNYNQNTLEIIKNLPSKPSVVRIETRLDDVKFLDKKLDRICKTDPALLTNYLQDNIYSKEPDHFSIDDISKAFISVCKFSAIKQRKRISKTWFDKDCYQQNCKLKSALRFGCNQSIFTEKQLFKKMCRSKGCLYDLHRENSNIETAESDRSQFWNILKSKRTEVITSNVQNDD